MIDPTLVPILAARVDDVRPGIHIPPTMRQASCAGCGGAVLLAPSSRYLIEKGQGQAMCKYCVKRYYAGKTLADLTPILTATAREELREFVRREAEAN